LREEHGLRMSDNKELRKIFGSKKDDVKASGENYITRSFTIRLPHQMRFG
jgi:hypothetical protein